MTKLKPILLTAVFMIAFILTIPSILVLPFSSANTSKTLMEGAEPEMDWEKLLREASAVEVSVYRTEEDQVETIPLEQYVVGVVSAEMPVEFEEEALKAQSLAARTFIVKQLLEEKQVGILKGADVNDTEFHQVYKSEEELKEKWGANFHKNMNKIRKAVYETRGQILVYKGAPITASYFSTSNGFTENAENYWSSSVPYLKSVKSPWDLEAPRFITKTEMDLSEFEKKLGVKVEGTKIGEIISRTISNRVEKVRIGQKEFTGREIREKLGLRSADFTWERSGDKIIITTKGYGHGIGMSQYGANGMAKDGKTFEDIIKYYYNGVEITGADKYLEKVTAKK